MRSVRGRRTQVLRQYMTEKPVSAAIVAQNRQRLKHDLARCGLPREKVLACVVTLLITSAARVGNAGYARDNQSFGITTLCNRHASFRRGGRAVLDFAGKGGVRHEIW
jgi:DNA topoisomerase I